MPQPQPMTRLAYVASGLALMMGGMATVGLAPAIYGPLMNITGFSPATWWHRRPPQEEKVEAYNPIMDHSP